MHSIQNFVPFLFAVRYRPNGIYIESGLQAGRLQRIKSLLFVILWRLCYCCITLLHCSFWIRQPWPRLGSSGEYMRKLAAVWVVLWCCWFGVGGKWVSLSSVAWERVRQVLAHFRFTPSKYIGNIALLISKTKWVKDILNFLLFSRFSRWP